MSKNKNKESKKVKICAATLGTACLIGGVTLGVIAFKRKYSNLLELRKDALKN